VEIDEVEIVTVLGKEEQNNWILKILLTEPRWAKRCQVLCPCPLHHDNRGDVDNTPEIFSAKRHFQRHHVMVNSSHFDFLYLLCLFSISRHMSIMVSNTFRFAVFVLLA
jgi:hypothetical protein